MHKIAKFIVDKRKLFILLFIVMTIYAVVSIPKTNVIYDIASFLPDNTDTKRAIEVMADEFKTYGSATVMVKNVTYKTAKSLADEFEDIENVKMVTFDDSESCYKDANAKISITLGVESDSSESTAAITNIKKKLDGYDYVIQATTSTDEYSEMLNNEMTTILILAVVVIAAALLLTSKSYMEILVFPIIFGVSALLNMGTNFWLGKISFVTNSVAIVLQLALAVDYAIILCHRFTDELDRYEPRDAMITALEKAIAEISASSLTTVSGLVALMFMQLKLGYDIGIVMTKGIIFSMLTVFLLMPGILMMFSKGIKKTQHKSFIPKFKGFGKFVVKGRYVLPFIFIGLIVIFAGFQMTADYAFSYIAIDTKKPNEATRVTLEMEETFGTSTAFVVIVPKGDYPKEKKVLDMIESKEEVTMALGMSNVKINDDYYLTDAISYREFADLAGLSKETSRLLYLAYGIQNEQYSVINYIDDYKIPILDTFNYIMEQRDLGVIKLSDEVNESLDDLYDELSFAQDQMVGENYTRLVFTINLPVESQETFDFIDEIKEDVGEYYDDFVLAGEATSSYDLYKTFSADNLKITLMTALFIFVILLFTFKSAGLPVLLLLIIQGSVWINFGIPALFNQKIYFFAYLVISAIQMGATIDYAIVVTSRFNELKRSMDKKDAVIETLSQCFPTILTSGTIMTVAGFLLGIISSDPIIAGIGITLGRGTIISIVCVMILLPELLLIGDNLIEKTSFKIEIALPSNSRMMDSKVNGRIRGYVKGYIDADVKGVIKGEVRANVSRAEIEELKNATTDDGEKIDVEKIIEGNTPKPKEKGETEKPKQENKENTKKKDKEDNKDKGELKK